MNLIWDNSVRSNGNWQAIESAVIAAPIYTQAFSSHVVINMQLATAKSRVSPGGSTLGESESKGYSRITRLSRTL